jgi:hypothetical protein
MHVVEFVILEALAALRDAARPSIVIIEAAALTSDAIVEALRAGSPKAEIVILGEASKTCAIPGAHRLRGEVTAWRLSRFLRLAIARPALRSTLQAAYRLAHQQTSPFVEIAR